MSKGKGERLMCQVGRVQSSKSKVVSQRFESGWDPCNDEAQEKSPASNPIAMTTTTMISMSPLAACPLILSPLWPSREGGGIVVTLWNG